MPEGVFGLSQRQVKEPLSLSPCLWLPKGLLALLTLLLSFQSLAQGEKCQTFLVSKTIVLDSLPVDPSSVKVAASGYHFDRVSNALIFDQLPRLDSVEVCFLTMDPALFEPFYNRDIRLYEREGDANKMNASTLTVIPKEEIFQFNDMESYGAITRGVSFGNRQNLFVNSALNLQLDGQLSENLFVTASITDQNVPYQPEGNTQQIRDFDNVFIKLYNDQLELIAGDVVLENPVSNGYFLQYYKNVQGISASYKYNAGEKWKSRTSVSGSASKGQFYSAQLTPLEGIQGPYRLTGPNGERYIIVMANSERVFVDGQLLERGFDRDYVIDYNLGEITFSNSILITRYTRIRVDFEYAEQYYGRSNFTAAQELSNDRTKFYFNYYQEKDNPNVTLGYTVSDDDILALSQLGDNNGLGVISGVEETGFIEDAVLYFAKDTLYNGDNYTAYVFTTDPELATLKVSFTEVGTGNGDYALSTATTNGRVYEWVGPGQGQYAPVRTTPLPNLKRMVVLGNETKVSGYERMSHELSFSNRDLNLYSDLSDGDNQGLAWRGRLSSNGRKVGAYGFSGEVSFESLSENFTWIDRFRSIEYDRNWGYDLISDTVNRQDKILRSKLGLQKNALNRLTYDYSYRHRQAVVNGHQHDLEISKEIGPLLVQSNVYHMDNDPLVYKSEWFRLKQDVRFTPWFVQPGYQFTRDHQRSYISDSLVSTLMYYDAHDFYLQSGDSLSTSFRFDYIRREDQLPVEGSMQRYTSAEQFVASLQSYFLESQRVGLTANYRKVRDHIEATNDENILGKLDWQGTFFKKLVSQQFSYSTANTRELRREFIFILVPTGQGTHTWRDENEDGIQDLNEFYEAINYDEKNYAKIFTPTDDYINAFQSTFQHSVDARFPQRWESAGGLLKPISKLSLSTNIRLNYKSDKNDLLDRLNPFAFDIHSDQVISAQAQQRYTLFYNRNGSGLALDGSWSAQDNKTLLSNGFELRSREDWLANFRYSFAQAFTLRFQSGIGKTSNSSDYLASRNFKLLRNSWSPEVVWQPGNQLRVSTKVESRVKNQQGAEDNESSRVTDYQVESTWIRSGKGNFNVQLQWLSIQFDGEENTYLAYELLEGLQPGQNQKWNLNWQQSLSRGLQLTLQYNGRKSPGIRPIHTGTMQLTAFF